MTKMQKAVGAVVFLLFLMAFLPVNVNAEEEIIAIEDLDTPLKGEPDRVEIGQDGDLIIVTYQRNLGISLIHRNNDTIEHITTPDIESNSIYQLHYNEDDNVLFAVTGSGYQAYRTTLETIWLNNGTIQRIWLNYYANIINDIEYNSNTDTLFLGCNDGLWIIDVESQNITTKLDINSGLKPGGILDFFQEPTENLLWFTTSLTLTDLHIQSLDMSTNTISSESFNISEISNNNGYSPIRVIYSLLYDTTTRDIYVAFQFNETATGKDYYLACFDRDDTSKFVPLPTWYLTQGKEVTRSGDNHVFIETRIMDIHERDLAGDGPFFQGEKLGLIHFNTNDEKMSNKDTSKPISCPFSLLLLETIEPTFVYDAETDEYIDVNKTYIVPRFQFINDIAISPDDGTVVITDHDGITITNVEETETSPEPVGRESSNLFKLLYREHYFKPNPGLALEICRDEKIDKINATGLLKIESLVNDEIDLEYIFIIASSKLTVTDSEGNVIESKEGSGEILELSLNLKDLPSSEYTVRSEHRDALGNLVEFQESKFILDNPDKSSNSESDSKLNSNAIPAGIGIALLLVIGIGIGAGIVINKKKKNEKLEEEKEG